MPTIFHLASVLVVSIVAILALCFEWPCIAAITLIALDLYLIAVLVEAANRSAWNRKIAMNNSQDPPSYEVLPKLKWKIEFPERSWSLLQVLFLVLVAVVGFGALYMSSGEIQDSKGVVMIEKLDAIYYSIVTITTLGYGDFAPKGPHARLLVAWQLSTGLLLLLCIFPLVVARIADF